MKNEYNMKRNVKKFHNIEIINSYTIKNKWNIIKATLKSQAREIKGIQKIEVRKPWMTDKIVKLINERRKYKPE